MLRTLSQRIWSASTSPGFRTASRPALRQSLKPPVLNTRSFASSRGRPYGGFDRAQRAYAFFKARPRLVASMGAGSVVFYFWNLETVPGSGRRRFNWVSPDLELRMSQEAFDAVIEEYGHKILPDTSPQARLVQRVLERLIPHTGISNQGNWEVRVIDDPTKNAFVIPGNKVFVFTGMFDITQSEDALAAVLAHEIAHNVAHHTGERLSKQLAVALPLIVGLTLFVDVSAQISAILVNLLITSPGSRTQESEADYLGLLIMARSCYDPEEAIHLWERMYLYEQQSARQQGGGPPPQFLSTHPSSQNRIKQIKAWLPEAQMQSEASDCAQMIGYGKLTAALGRLTADAFNVALKHHQETSFRD